MSSCTSSMVVATLYGTYIMTMIRAVTRDGSFGIVIHYSKSESLKASPMSLYGPVFAQSLGSRIRGLKIRQT